jgi:hypothetical protein
MGEDILWIRRNTVTTASKLFVKVAAGSGASLLLLLGSHGRSAGLRGPMHVLVESDLP